MTRTRALNDCIDEAYPAKCESSPYLKPMITGAARNVTVRSHSAEHHIVSLDRSGKFIA